MASMTQTEFGEFIAEAVWSRSTRDLTTSIVPIISWVNSTSTPSTYATLETQVLSLLGRDDASTKSKVLCAVNAAQDMLSYTGEWGDLETFATLLITANIDTYAKGSDVRKLYNLVLRDTVRAYPPLTYVQPQMWDVQILPVHHQMTGRPTMYTVWSGSIKLHPTPDTDYTIDIRYARWPKIMANATDILDYQNKDSLIVYLATGLVWLALEEPKIADTYLSMANKVLKSAGIDDTSLLNYRQVPARDLANIRSGQTYNDPFMRRS